MQTTYKKLIEQGKYDYTYITPNFNQNEKVEVSKAKVIELHLNEYLTTQEVIDKVEVQGYRLATFAEALQYGIDNPKAQLDNQLVTVEVINTKHWYLILDRRGSERSLDVRQCHLGGGWDEGCRFLVVRKSGAKKSEDLASLVSEHLETIKKEIKAIEDLLTKE